MPPEIFVVPNPFGFLVTIVQYVYFPLLWQLTFVGTVKLASSGGLLNHLIMEHNTSSAGEAEVHCPHTYSISIFLALPLLLGQHDEV